MTRPNLRRLLIDQIYNVAAAFLYSAGVCYFARTAAFAPGGVSGLALILHHLFTLPIGLTTLALNLPLMVLCWRFLGRGFLARSFVSMLWCTVFQDVVFARLPAYAGEPMLAALFTGILWGAGLALFYMRGSSSGGTDFLTLTIKSARPHLSVGAVTGSIDVAIILLGWAVYGSVDAILYGLVTTVTTSLVIDKIMYGSSASKMLMIVTDHGQAVADVIAARCDRGSTMVRGIGTYTGNEKQVVWCACSRPEVYPIRTAAYEVDPRCLVMVSDTGEVYGEGFADPQEKARARPGRERRHRVRIGFWELIVIFAVALLVIGPDKLPYYARRLGQALQGFRDASNELTKDLRETVVEPLEEAQRPLREAMQPLTELTDEVNDNLRGLQKSVNDLGKPPKPAPKAAAPAEPAAPAAEPATAPAQAPAPAEEPAPPAPETPAPAETAAEETTTPSTQEV